MSDLLKLLIDKVLGAQQPAPPGAPPSLPGPSTELYPDVDWYPVRPQEAQAEAMRLFERAGPDDMIRPKRAIDYGGIQDFDVFALPAMMHRGMSYRQAMDAYGKGLDEQTAELDSDMPFDATYSMFRKFGR